MKPTRLTIGGLVALGVLAASLAGAGPQPLKPQPLPPGVESVELAAAVEAIAKAPTPDQAMTAYARGCTLNRRSRVLQDTYLRAMLSFGRPDVAHFAALELDRIDPTHGLAQGVIAYVLAERGQFAKALSAALNAAELEGDNAPILQNAALLAVWYENAPPLPDAQDPLVQQIARLRASPAVGRRFSAACDRAEANYGRLAKLRNALAEKAAAAEAETKDAFRELRRLDKEVSDLSDLYRSEMALLFHLRRELTQVMSALVNATPNSPQWQALNARRIALQGEIRERSMSTVRLYQSGRAAQQDRRTQEDTCRQKRGEMLDLKAQLSAVIDAAQPLLSWQPPAVGGKVVMPVMVVAGPASARPATQPAAVVAQAEAQGKLKLARLYLTNGMETRAKALLAEIVRSHPNTPAAKAATGLLKELQPNTGPADKDR